MAPLEGPYFVVCFGTRDNYDHGQPSVVGIPVGPYSFVERPTVHGLSKFQLSVVNQRTSHV